MRALHQKQEHTSSYYAATVNEKTAYPELTGEHSTDICVIGGGSGGLPVAVVIQKKIGIELDVAVVSKITLPWNTEAGYGAIAFDGTCRLNEAMLAHIDTLMRELEDRIQNLEERLETLESA